MAPVPKITRGFVGRRSSGRDPRLPPGQYDAGADWPVLTAEVTPRLNTDRWSFAIDGLVEKEASWSWSDMLALPRSTYDGDIHCVTTWSKLGMSWSGVSLDTLFAVAGPLPAATHVLATSHTGYTTNVPLADVTGGRAWVAWEVDGKPLPVEHGGPARLLVPHLYFWKSAKWIARVTLLPHDQPGFWEVNGYHNHGDPWTEERYDGD